MTKKSSKAIGPLKLVEFISLATPNPKIRERQHPVVRATDAGRTDVAHLQYKKYGIQAWP
jgi:hypothetical protein